MGVIKNRLPNAAAIRGFPNAPARRTEVIFVRLPGDAGNRRHAAGAMWANKAPTHAGIQVGTDLLGTRDWHTSSKRQHCRKQQQRMRTRPGIEKSDHTPCSGPHGILAVM